MISLFKRFSFSLLLVGQIILLASCDRKINPSPRATIPPAFLNAELLFEYNGELKEWPVAISDNETEDDVIDAIAISEFDGDLEGESASMSFVDVPINNMGDTITIIPRQPGSSSPTSNDQIFYFGLYLWNADVLEGKFDLDTTRYNWLVIQDWNPETEELRATFQLSLLAGEGIPIHRPEYVLDSIEITEANLFGKVYRP